jgi:hypothetical protein
MPLGQICHVNPAYVICEFTLAEERTMKTGQQLYEDICTNSNDMPYAYVMLINDESQSVLLHHES